MVIHNKGMDNQATVDLLVANGRKALAELQKLSQEQIDEICKYCLQEFVKQGEDLAREAVRRPAWAQFPLKSQRTAAPPLAYGMPSRARRPRASSATMKSCM